MENTLLPYINYTNNLIVNLEKKKLWQLPGDLEGFGQAFVVSEEQKLDWGDMFYMLTLPTRLRKPHLFPKLPLPFRSLSFLSLSQ